MKLTWTKCGCCKRNYPTNLGTFYEGSGFSDEEVAFLNRAVNALERITLTEDENNRAGIEGWGVFGNVIERIDDMSVFCPLGDGNAIFVCDEDALAHVRQQAALNPLSYHAKALAYVECPAR